MINKKRIVKFILSMVLISLASLFLTSCSSLFNSASKFRPYDLRGTWRNSDNYSQRFTISSYGILTFYNDDGSYSTHYIENWDNEKYNEKSYYELIIPNLPILGNITFYFTSDRECEISYGSVSGITYYFEKTN
ncbi:hypothetical protein BFL38_09490 [Brachyspira hampsonii]|uniref:Lipocalin-like domain-containing protein n=1 Tax=Brachyspira hampsonii TaxID=1287055 RepID=A0A1E5NHT5_9SPIR|nr:hypothetical protein [Brachyspira hampsonii]OEJ15694.1 hypothetical protein BFL38_09490 [Brachyspira hampsonii]